MSQYRVGTIEVTNGSGIVTAVDPDPDNGSYAGTQWLSEAHAGDFLAVAGDDYLYKILSVQTDKQLTLEAYYLGATTVLKVDPPFLGAAYAIVRDFSPAYDFPLVNKGDIETTAILREAERQIEDQLASLDARISALEP